MAGASELAAQGFERCRGCGTVKFIIPDALREQLRVRGEDPAVLDRCLACEQHAVIRTAWDTGRMISLDEFRIILNRAGRSAEPWLLFDARCFNVISDATITAVTSDVWSGAEYPQDWLHQADWLDLFNVAGFTVDGCGTGRPEQSVTLWRGCVSHLRRRMSWTSDRGLAQKFATEGFRGRPQGELYQTTAPPQVILCINHASRHESEYVINTRGLAICKVPVDGNDCAD